MKLLTYKLIKTYYIILNMDKNKNSDIYEKSIKSVWKKEREKLIKTLKNNEIPLWLNDKVDNFIKRTYLNENSKKEIIERLLKGDEILVTFFMRDPKRQNIYEKIFIKEMIKNNIEVIKLNSSGKNAFYVIDDEIKTNIVKPIGHKSLDFLIKIKNKEIYLINKYTNEEGGSQDNQFNDVIIQLKNIGTKTRNKVWVCLDGEYYTKEKIDKLISLNKNAIITNLQSLIKKTKDNKKL